MNILVRQITSRLVAMSMKQRLWSAPRKRVLADVEGDILEIGFGSGANLPFYPPKVHRITAIEPDASFARLARKPVARSHIEVDLQQAAAESLPFEEESFDCIVSTLTICSLSDPDRALREIKRVLKPGGRFLFMEHGLADCPHIRKWQHRLTHVTKTIACGCHLNRDIPAILHQAEFKSLCIRKGRIPNTPAFVGLLSEGYAEK